jgi:predicted amidophosphoribosyltransferase
MTCCEECGNWYESWRDHCPRRDKHMSQESKELLRSIAEKGPDQIDYLYKQ